MPRVSKKPEERRQEILDVAELLFRQRGFENVQVSDIVASLGVAQGTFYYYFTSKDDALRAILERNWAAFAEMASRMAGPSQDPLSRLLGLMRGFFAPTDPKYSVESYFGSSASPDLIGRFHAMFDDMRLRLFAPVITEIVSEGIEQGVFAPLDHVQGIVEVIFVGISSYMHTHAPQFADENVAREAALAVGELIEKVLGLPRGSFDIMGTGVPETEAQAK